MKANVFFVKGVDLWAAAISGAERGYNRTTDDYVVYKDIFKKYFEACCKKYVPDSIQSNLNWKTAQLPVMFLMFHEHYYSAKIREQHVRVMLPETRVILDITTDAWNKLVKKGVIAQ